MRIYDVIANKRDKKELSKEEIDFFVQGFTSGEVADYQAAALLMAIVLNGMTIKETSYLTEAMAKSGDMADLSKIDGIKVDKHSTGGVGDKTTLVVAPIALINIGYILSNLIHTNILILFQKFLLSNTTLNQYCLL